MTIPCDDHLYFDLPMLQARGWTDSLVHKYLGSPDSWAPVEHWANFTGKRLWHLRRVEGCEADSAFEKDYRASLKRRRIDPERESQFANEQARTRGQVAEWESHLTDADRKTLRVVAEAAAIMSAPELRGYRTPHKARGT